MKKMFTVQTFLLAYAVAIQDLICNGDFQIYLNPLKFTYVTGQFTMWGTFPEDSKCWYRIPSGQIEVQNTSYALFHTKMIQLSAINDNFALCQTVTLLNGAQYSLSVDVVKPMPVTSATAFLYLNNVLVSNVTSTDHLNSSKMIYNFTSLTNINQICINGSVVNSLITPLFLDDFTPLIDNVSLIQVISISNTLNISNTTNLSQYNSNVVKNSSGNFLEDIFVFLQLTYNQDDGSIFLNSTHPLPYSQFLMLKNYGKIYIEGEEQTDIMSLYDIVTNFFNITIKIKRDYDLNTVYVAFPPHIISAFMIKLVVSIDGKSFQIYFISEKMINVVQTIDPISNFVIDGVTKSYSVLKLTFCSYFVINIINFYTLALLYNFLGLSAQPIFSRIALEKLSSIFYKRNSLFQYIQGIVNSSKLQQDWQFQNFSRKENERVDKYYKNFSWLGNMGITSNFLCNNLENIVLLGILITKILILTFLKRKFPIFTNKLFGKLKNLFDVVIIQFICMSPLMTISAFSALMKPGYTKFTETINFLFHLVLQFMMILSPFLYLLKVTKYGYHNKDQKNKKKIKIIQMNFFSYLFNTLLPILIVIKSQKAFFVVITFYILLLVLIYFNCFLSYSIFIRIFKSIMILILVIHHFSFMLIYLTDIMNQKFGRNQSLNQSCKIAGLIVIFTVLCGGLVEILYFIRKVCGKIITNLKKCLSKIKIQSQNSIQRQNNLKNKVNQNKIIQKCTGEEPNQIQYIVVQRVQRKQTIQLKQQRSQKKKKVIFQAKSQKNRKAFNANTNTNTKSKRKIKNNL